MHLLWVLRISLLDICWILPWNEQFWPSTPSWYQTPLFLSINWDVKWKSPWYIMPFSWKVYCPEGSSTSIVVETCIFCLPIYTTWIKRFGMVSKCLVTTSHLWHSRHSVEVQRLMKNNIAQCSMLPSAGDSGRLCMFDFLQPSGEKKYVILEILIDVGLCKAQCSKLLVFLLSRRWSVILTQKLACL